MNPLGGLPRRKTALQQLGKKPLLALDAGNALFKSAAKPSEHERDRAAFVLEAMGQAGTKALVAGARDLAAGVGFLGETAKQAGVQVLSANLRAGGKKPFPGSAIFEVGGVKVGVVGLSAPGPVEGLEHTVGGPLLEAARAELAKLEGKVDLKVLLAAVPYADALQLATELKAGVDVIAQSSDARGALMQRVEHALLVGGGDKGKVLATVALDLDGQGPLFDLSELDREKQLLSGIESNLKIFQARLEAAQDAEGKKQLQKTLGELKARREQQKKKIDQASAKGARTARFDMVFLDSRYADDEALRKKMMVFEPSGRGSH